MDKKAYTPAEFAELFGREKSWAYRLIKSSKLKVLPDLGRLLIPASELKRLETVHSRYIGGPENTPETKTTASGGSKYTEWVGRRKEAAKQAMNGSSFKGRPPKKR